MPRPQKSFLGTALTVERTWILVDLDGQVLGRAASKIAKLLRGKDNPRFSPNADTGHFVIAMNANKVRFTGKKLDTKIYYHHTGYPGGMKEQTARERLQKDSEKLVLDTVWGMLPKNFLSRKILTKLKVYPGETHPHQAQKFEK